MFNVLLVGVLLLRLSKDVVWYCTWLRLPRWILGFIALLYVTLVPPLRACSSRLTKEAYRLVA